MSTSYHPETDGQTEVLNRCLETYLRCFASDQPSKWSSFLAWAEYSYNTGFHTSLGTTPFRAVHGRDPPSLAPYTPGDTNNHILEEQLSQRDDMLLILRDNLLKAQQQMKDSADKKRREVSFQEGDLVFLRVRPYRQKTLAKRRCQKLPPRFFGPYRITRKVGAVAYELQLPVGSRVHPMFHVSLLKPARWDSLTASTDPLPITKDWEIDLLPHEVLGHRWLSGTDSHRLELLISWQHRPAEEATWEDYDLLREQFPLFRLEDKSSFGRGSVDSIRVYSQKKKQQRSSAEEKIDCRALRDPDVIFESLLGKRSDPYAEDMGGI